MKVAQAYYIIIKGNLSQLSLRSMNNALHNMLVLLPWPIVKVAQAYYIIIKGNLSQLSLRSMNNALHNMLVLLPWPIAYYSFMLSDSSFYFIFSKTSRGQSKVAVNERLC